MARHQLIQGLLLAVILPASLACIPSISRGYDDDFEDNGSPSYCNGIGCPSFAIVSTINDRTEERLYEAAKWASTEVLDLDYRSAVREGFMKLFSYISGENDAGVKIDMTAPVSNRVIPGQGPTCESNFTISFYVPSQHQDSPPTPTNPDVFLTDFPERRIYVRSFGGRASQEDWIDNAAKLGRDLTNAGLNYDSSYFYTAGYNGPYTIFNRHNEVWFMADE